MWGGSVDHELNYCHPEHDDCPKLVSNNVDTNGFLNKNPYLVLLERISYPKSGS